MNNSQETSNILCRQHLKSVFTLAKCFVLGNKRNYKTQIPRSLFNVIESVINMNTRTSLTTANNYYETVIAPAGKKELVNIKIEMY